MAIAQYAQLSHQRQATRRPVHITNNEHKNHSNYDKRSFTNHYSNTRNRGCYNYYQGYC